MSKREFPASFFLQDTLEVARHLLGAELSTELDGERTAGIIVEVEAYGASEDPACHAFRGETARNRMLFSEGGHVYVYRIYGVHHCVNVSTETQGKGCGILIRAIEPTDGLEIMRARRGGVRDSLLTNGPGRVCQALAIDATLGGDHYLTSPRIQLTPKYTFTNDEIAQAPRIGISQAQELPWRYYVRGNRFVSRKV